MDFLKSAVASAISKGPPFPYSFSDRVDVDQSIWTLHNGTKREDSSKCSIFSFDVTANKSRLPLARNALRKLRTLRHPGVVKVLDTVETETYIYIATERLTPLSWHTRRKALAEETMKWGLHNVAKTVKFINTDATSVHGCIRTSSIFMSESGEWKLTGFDVLSSMKDDDAIIYTYGSLLPDSGRYASPEVSKSGWEAIRQNPVHAVDAYDFGILIFEVFTGTSIGNEQVGQTKTVPPSMHQSYKRLLNANPKARLSVGQFLDQGRRHGGFFQTPLIQITEDIDNLGLKADAERDELLSQLDDVADDFPEDFFKMKVLPELLKSVEFGGGGPKVFGAIMKISSKLSDEEYDTQITPVIVRLFSSPDRAIRVCLLDNLPLMIEHLSQKIVNDKIFPQMVTGFTDVAPLVREQTVKAVLTIVPKLSDRIINGELLRYLAKTANDEQAGIRTNTTICLGKIARNLGNHTRTKVLAAAFARSLRDPFVHARNAALMALAATCDLFSEEDCATKLLPGICPSLVDKEKIVRDQANKTFDLYLQRIRKYGQSLPDTALPPPTAAGVATTNTPRMGTPQQDTSWAGWAISSFTKNLATASGEMQSGANGNGVPAPQEGPSSVPPTTSSKANRTLGTSSLQRSPLIKTNSSSANPFSAPSSDVADNENDIETQDFSAAWGDEDEDADKSSAFDPFAAKPTPGTPAVHYDDGGEPDFAGWLTARSVAKNKPKNPLPKGLTKTAKLTTSRPIVAGRANTTGHTATKKTSMAPPKPVPKKVEQKAEVEDEGWGDAWD
ncbi:ARM repeat-containing protein [Mytilinidion resinicola]|uniref:ARM repeat-containing protein n=1 Tax=Mytilinidion resinicola TaxID=574789 RepID=A0A6A6YM60_9PEZI|nr:ARM repeat-containing protein [Mytilinidion resinicola]KAF2809663.1 ARM repeat-containing protein [Mytilinidion resinicola]